MNVEEIPIEAIDLRDETFRISEDLDSQALRASLQAVGQLAPVIVVPKESAHQILCGFRRVRALRELGRTRVWARIFKDGFQDALAAFLPALWDNLAHRHLDPLEKARVLFTLKTTCGLKPETLVETYLPLLDLAPHRNVLAAYLSLHTLHPTLRQMLKDAKITLASAERLAEMSRDSQEAITALLPRIHLSASLQKEVLGLIDELSVIMTSSIRDLLSRTEIQAVVADPLLSPHQRGEKLRTLLYRWRNPRLSLATDRFLTGKLELDLPGSVRLIPDPFFETPRLRVEFDASSAERFREIAGAIQKASQAPALDKLFEVC